MSVGSKIAAATGPVGHGGSGFVSLLVFLLSIGGCSNEQMYEAIRSNRLSACEEFVGRRYDDCVAQHEADYREFNQARSEALETN